MQSDFLRGGDQETALINPDPLNFGRSIWAPNGGHFHLLPSSEIR